jgi:hypothetical protein
MESCLGGWLGALKALKALVLQALQTSVNYKLADVGPIRAHIYSAKALLRASLQSTTFHAGAFRSRRPSSRISTYIQIRTFCFYKTQNSSTLQCRQVAFLEVPVIGRVEGKCPYVNTWFVNSPPRGLSPLATSLGI